MKKYLLLAIIVTVFSCSTEPGRTVSSINTDATVMITNLAKNSGGSGVIVRSSRTGSEVLTNAHVCAVAKRGALITSTTGKEALATSYVVSKTHDLCLIKVDTDFDVNTPLAEYAPKKYDRATISGHPHLLPNIVTFGHFSDKKIVQVMIGQRECSKADFQNPNTALFCLFVGHLPIVKSYQAIVVSATIQPGSSGSGIFNSDHELAGLVFAGSGDLAYAMAVPYEYIAYFLGTELKTLQREVPDLSVGGSGESGADKSSYVAACKYAITTGEKAICKIITSSTFFN